MRSGANNESVGSHNYPIIHFGCSLVQGSGAVKKGQTIRNLKLLQYLPIYVWPWIYRVGCQSRLIRLYHLEMISTNSASCFFRLSPNCCTSNVLLLCRYFFAEVFDFFRIFFLIVFHVNILFMLLPLAIRLNHRLFFLAFLHFSKFSIAIFTWHSDEFNSRPAEAMLNCIQPNIASFF